MATRSSVWIRAMSTAGWLAAASALAQSGTPPAPAGQAAPAASAAGAAPSPGAQQQIPTAKPAGAPVRNLPARFAGRAGMYYKAVWGIDSLKVKWVESGEMIRFTWRVLDPEKAKVLNDKNLQPALIDPKAGVSLVVPVMEKVGQLRQSAPPETGRSYWMTFSNKGRPVRRGDRVNVEIGPFHAQNLAVD